MKTTILMPVYNEAATINNVLEAVGALGPGFETVIVDDGSKDGTYEWLLKAKSEGRFPFVSGIFTHGVNRGKGAAVRTAIEKAGGDILVIQDADLEYSPSHIPLLVKAIEAGEADIVYGSRLLEGKTETSSPVYLWGNQFLTWLVNIFCGSRFTDSYTCYKAFKKDAAKNLALESDGFEIEAEISVKAALRGYRIKEIPVAYKPRSRQEGKKINWRDAVKGVIKIASTWLSEKRRGSTPSKFVD